MSAERDRTRPRDRHWSSWRSVQGDDYQAGREFHSNDGRQIAEAAFSRLMLDPLTHQSRKQHFSEFRMAAALVAWSAIPHNAVMCILFSGVAFIRRKAGTPREHEVCG